VAAWARQAERAALQAKWEERERALLEEAAELRAAAAEGRAAAEALDKARGEAERLQDAAKRRAGDLQRTQEELRREKAPPSPSPPPAVPATAPPRLLCRGDGWRFMIPRGGAKLICEASSVV
jgi:hypothetical protein